MPASQAVLLCPFGFFLFNPSPINSSSKDYAFISPYPPSFKRYTSFVIFPSPSPSSCLCLCLHFCVYKFCREHFQWPRRILEWWTAGTLLGGMRYWIGLITGFSSISLALKRYTIPICSLVPPHFLSTEWDFLHVFLRISNFQDITILEFGFIWMMKCKRKREYFDVQTRESCTYWIWCNLLLLFGCILITQLEFWKCMSFKYEFLVLYIDNIALNIFFYFLFFLP